MSKPVFKLYFVSTMNIDDTVHLNNIADHALESIAYVKGMDYNSFAREEEVQAEVARNLQMVGQAIMLLSDECKENFEALDIQAFVGLKNTTFNTEYEIDPHGLWSIINEDMPRLREAVMTEIEKYQRENKDAILR